MENRITYETALVKDAELLADTRIIQLHEEEEQPDHNIRTSLVAWFREHIGDGSLYQIILRKNGSLIATGGLYEMSIPPSFFEPHGKIGYIANMYTIPSERGNHYATEILKLLKKEAEKRTCDLLLLGASEQGKPVYEKFGFIYADAGWMKMNLSGGK